MNEKNLARSFVNQLPKDVQSCLRSIWLKNYYPYFVGGCVRDFILSGKIVQDLDIELHYQSFLKEDKRKENWQDLKLKLASLYEVEELAYEVLKLKVGDSILELSQPRQDSFDKTKQKGHHDFECKLFGQLPLESAFRRRDFTINALSISFNKDDVASFHDPLGGLADLKNKTLRACSEQFVFDPVRLLRAIRFYFRFGFRFDDELLSMLQQMSLEKISHFYVWQEALKSGRFFLFLKKLANFVKTENSLKKCLDAVATQEEKLDDWYSQLLSYFPKHERGKLIFLVLALDSKISIEEKKKICEYFQISPRLLERIENLKQLQKRIFTHPDMSLVFKMNSTKFSDFKIDFLQDVNQLKSLLKKMNWPKREANEKKLLSHLQEMLKSEYPFNGQIFYEFAKAISGEIPLDENDYEEVSPSQRGAYYCFRLLKENLT